MNSSFPTGSMPAEERLAAGRRRYSICTLVTDAERYSDLVSSFIAHGFTPPECEFLYLDNSAINRFDAYRGVNLFLRVAFGDYIVICHQDIELLDDGRDRLDAVIAELDQIEPSWGVFGNAGGLSSGGLARRISDPHREDDRQGGPFPVPVVSLDENFIVIRADANMATSADLSGFHLYGTDLVLGAERLGYHAYVVDFHLRHHGRGRIDESFVATRSALADKLGRLSRSRWIVTPCTYLPVLRSPLLRQFALTRGGGRIVRFVLKLRRWAAVAFGIEERNARRQG